MKRVIYRDSSGRVVACLLRDTDEEDHPEIGIPIEPPPIERVIRESAQDVQDELVTRGILTYKDVVASQNGVSAAIRDVLLRKIIEAYKLKELEDNGH